MINANHTQCTPDIQERIKAICAKYEVSLERMRCIPRIKGKEIRAMVEISTYLRREKYWSYPAIGDFMHRDHTTILHHVRGKKTVDKGNVN